MQRKVRPRVREAEKLRELAAWYRGFAGCAGSTVIWESRRRMADDLDREADQLMREWIGRKPSPVETVRGTPDNPAREHRHNLKSLPRTQD
jgi:hypothetical protein